ncbi:MAG: glycine cleavage system protein GcvH [Proteobacteria bacterium]|nr:glycine cleavage system protein GcvH [Pseudomonadota bacterium]
MSNIPTELKYTKTHEWASKDEEDVITIGITAHAQHLLGDIVYLELPEVETQVHVGEEFGVIESVKAASDLYSPISGEVIAVNSELISSPGLINTDPYHEGWLIKIQPDDPEQFEELMDAEEYEHKIEKEQK